MIAWSIEAEDKAFENADWQLVACSALLDNVRLQSTKSGRRWQRLHLVHSGRQQHRFSTKQALACSANRCSHKDGPILALWILTLWIHASTESVFMKLHRGAVTWKHQPSQEIEFGFFESWPASSKSYSDNLRQDFEKTPSPNDHFDKWVISKFTPGRLHSKTLWLPLWSYQPQMQTCSTWQYTADGKPCRKLLWLSLVSLEQAVERIITSKVGFWPSDVPFCVNLFLGA